MYRSFVRAVYYINMAVQALFSLAVPIGLAVLFSWFLSSRGWVGEWIYVPLILLGVFVGLFSMVRFVLTVSAQLHALEKEHKDGEIKKDKDNFR